MSAIKKSYGTFLLLALLLVPTAGHGQIQASTLPIQVAVQGYAVPSGTLDDDTSGAVLLTVSLDIEPDWYIYANIPGETGKPTHLSAVTAGGIPLRVVYPAAKEKQDTFDPSVTIGSFTGQTRFYALVPRGMDGAFPVSLKLDMLLCHPTKCVPGRVELTFGQDDLDTASLPSAGDQPWWHEFLQRVEARTDTKKAAIAIADAAESAIIEWSFTPTYFQPGLEVGGLLSAILMGLLAGLILNIMPCVLPVVSLKLSALLGAGAEGHGDPVRAFRQHNVFFVLGILTFFVFLAVALWSTGAAWGALFQNRWLVLGLAGIMGALGLSLFGLFHLPVIDLKFGAGHLNPKKQAFFTGMLTTLLATPCSGPFLGGVLGWALVQGPSVIATVFLSIGMGMASPYLLLILNPKLARFLPKSGPWIEYVEKGIAFFLLGTAFYLVSIALGSWTLPILAPLWTILFGGWLWLRSRSARRSTAVTVRAAALVLLGLAVFWTLPSPPAANPWESFEPTALSRDIGNEPLLLDFTADWCPTCKVLEATVMTAENVNAWKARYGVRFIKVDMTQRDPEAEALLLALGSRSLPTVALFRRGDAESPLVIRDLFTANQLEQAQKSL